MRINVYSQELTNETHLVRRKSDTGIVYHAVRIMLHSPPILHDTRDDDDRSAVTFWLPASKRRRKQLADAFRDMANMIENSPEGVEK